MNQTSDAIRAELLPGEHVRWSGRPRKDLLFTRGDLFLVPFSILWFSFAVSWEISVIAEEGDPFFLLWGIPFLLIGLYFTVGRFVYKRRRRERTFYGVTDRRVLSVTLGRRRTVQAQFIDLIPTMNRSVRKDGVGTIRFGSNPGPFNALYQDTGMEFMWPYGTDVPTFYDVDDVDRVYDLVQRLSRKETT
jgi:hypothetical protein